MNCLRNLPTRTPANFTSLPSSAASYQPVHQEESTKPYIPTYDASESGSHQVITTESTSILVREFEHGQNMKAMRSTTGKRQMEPSQEADRRSKHPRRQCLFEGNYRQLLEGSVPGP
ncbi:hypothetical protein CVIRNUC_001495 [Coccomyxa viridis]|uniref:DET1- and DDB1-associated protein 1 domain-containing protein n=1 Tax=Coccomyxa viridis TaxID=1274662 RepID=A0AAV1HWS7_9CHLO|nr:hypothetical protein CVIRNUC_001495 [Coccomyxa viridis]